MEDKQYQYGGARVLVAMHGERIKDFATVWKRAKAAGLELADPTDKDYRSLEHLLYHVVGCARGYMEWMCEVLELPDPGFEATPKPGALEADLDRYVEHLIERWDGPLCDVEPKRFDRPAHQSRWNVTYCIDGMLEHAVMHPVRHSYQLERLMEDMDR